VAAYTKVREDKSSRNKLDFRADGALLKGSSRVAFQDCLIFCNVMYSNPHKSLHNSTYHCGEPKLRVERGGSVAISLPPSEIASADFISLAMTFV